MARFRDNRGKLGKGAQTRQEILAKAVQLASVEGLEALSIGVLAKQTGMSKSGLFQHFGSKQKLQLAILEAQGEHFAAEVLGIRESEQKGLFRLWQLVESWLRNARRGEYFSGSFFLAASFEYDSRSGPLANNVVAVLKKWLSAIAQA